MRDLIRLGNQRREQLIDITDDVLRIAAESGVKNGLV